MIRKFIKQVKTVKFLFKLPNNIDLVIFDNISLRDLKDNLLKKINYFMISNRTSEIANIYITYSLLLKIFLNLGHYFRPNINLRDIYFLSLIELINPKKVFTYVDNSHQFSKISKLANKKIQFIALQNGGRFDWAEADYLFKRNILKKNPNKNFYIDHYLCFGDFEKFQAKKYKINIKNFSTVGSLRLANLLSNFKHDIKKKKYDICLLSEYNAWQNIMNNVNVNDVINVEASYINLVKYLIKFSKSCNLKFILTFKMKNGTQDHSNEMKWFKKNFSFSEYKFLLKNSLKNTLYSSYKVSFKSEVTVGMYSTLLREILSCNQKILSCNLSRSKIYSFPIDGICKIDSCNYREFEKRLELILKINKFDYFKKIKEKIKKIMPITNPDETFKKIRTLLI